jgi:hypothetical protein
MDDSREIILITNGSSLDVEQKIKNIYFNHQIQSICIPLLTPVLRFHPLTRVAI